MECEIHQKYICEKLWKKIQISQLGNPPVYKLVHIIQNNVEYFIKKPI